MASSKDTFEAKTFAANSFACGTFRGLGVDAAAAVPIFRPAITYDPDRRPITYNPDRDAIVYEV